MSRPHSELDLFKNQIAEVSLSSQGHTSPGLFELKNEVSIFLLETLARLVGQTVRKNEKYMKRFFMFNNILLEKLLTSTVFNFLSAFCACWVKKSSSQVKEEEILLSLLGKFWESLFGIFPPS